MKKTSKIRSQQFTCWRCKRYFWWRKHPRSSHSNSHVGDVRDTFDEENIQNPVDPGNKGSCMISSRVFLVYPTDGLLWPDCHQKYLLHLQHMCCCEWISDLPLLMLALWGRSGYADNDLSKNYYLFASFPELLAIVLNCFWLIHH